MFLMGGSVKSIVQWGGDAALLVSQGQWWRLVSAIFVHIGVIHLLFNSYALIFIGPLLEELLGRERFLVIYVGTGVFGFVVSNAYYHPVHVTAGASGAIFGLIGAGIILSRKWAAWGSLLKEQLVHWAIYGLGYGLLVGANNAAHIGGFLSGMGHCLPSPQSGIEYFSRRNLVEDPLLGSFIADDSVPRFGLPFGNHALKFSLGHEIGLAKADS